MSELLSWIALDFICVSNELAMDCVSFTALQFVYVCVIQCD